MLHATQMHLSPTKTETVAAVFEIIKFRDWQIPLMHVLLI